MVAEGHWIQSTTYREETKREEEKLENRMYADQEFDWRMEEHVSVTCCWSSRQILFQAAVLGNDYHSNNANWHSNCYPTCPSTHFVL